MSVTVKQIASPDRVPLRRALLSVSDKTGVADFAAALAARGVEIVSTGGTAKTIAAAGVAVVDVSALTGFPEIMDGRVKTLHPAVHGGLLGVRDDPEHASAMAAHGIPAIDLLVVDLYPFEATVAAGAARAAVVENIDIGGPGDDPRRLEEPRLPHRGRRPGRLRRRARRSGGPRRRHHHGAAPQARRQGVRPHGRLRRGDRRLVRRGCRHAVARRGRDADFRGVRRPARRGDALWREPAPARRLLPRRQRPAGRRHRPPAAGQGALLQQRQRHRRRLRARRRVRPGGDGGRRHHQARQPLRRRRGHEPPRCLPQGARLRPGLGLRRHRRAQPAARRRGGPRHRRGVHRGDRRARRHRRGGGDRRRQEEPAPARPPAACPSRARPG